MVPARIINEEWAVDARLKEVFGVSRAELIPVVREIVGARGDAVENDPVTAAGQFAYIHGVRNIRALFRSKGWFLLRKDNIELVRHPERALSVGYQSVDLAASPLQEPMAISGKGSGAERVIQEAQGSLFSDDQIEEQAAAPRFTGLWHFCVSVVGDDVRAEMSLSKGIKNKNFAGFYERIFVLNKGDWGAIEIERNGQGRDGGEPVEFEPVIVRK